MAAIGAVVGATKLLSILMALVDLGVEGMAAAQRLSKLIQQRRDEGKDVTVQDMRDAIGHDDAAKVALEDAISKAQ